ncbi:oncostatin-M-specific receptor subunit beta-like [Hyperolius riggenbachi]|uniref:oncostatin-M-specific receptor subunit beta-like n=1 Tax=Hyperolius riggenbachi TaxID=752182 RepID=UPI0035A33A19
MDQCGGLHGIITISLLIIFQLGLRSCQGSLKLLHLELHTDPQEAQRLIVKWNISDSIYSPGSAVIFHIQVARSANKNILHSVHYNTSLSERGETFSWTWDSELPLECDSHSVRIRSAVLRDSASYEWSGWSQWKTHHGKNELRRNKIEIYPHERIVLEGSDVISCCLPDLQETVLSMEYDRVPYPNQSLQMKTDSFVIALRNVSITKSSGKNILCRVSDNKHHGTVLIVSRPPNEPQDFSCETNDLQKFLCRWAPGPRYNFYSRLTEKFTLQERLSGKSTSCLRETCAWPIAKDQQIYNFTLMVENRLGMKSINAIVNLTERVRPVRPTNLVATHVTARGAELSWTLSEDYTSLILHCQTHLQDRTVNVTLQGKTPRDRYSFSLTKLQPFTEYELRVRCRSQSSLAHPASDWSDILPFRTREDAPSGPVDVWREIQDDDAGRIVTVYWKHPPDFTANGILSHYNITWWQTGGNMSSNIIPAVDQNIYRLHIGRRACVISVTANNRVGMSPAAEIKIPGGSVSGSEGVMNTERAHGRDGGVAVWWRADPAASGYVVEWCSSPQSSHCGLQWKKYNASVHRDVIHSEAFQGGVRYDFQVYGSREDGEHLLGKLTGYTEELAPSQKPEVKILMVKANSVSLDWSPYPAEERQKGFITGYTIYVKNEGGDCKMEESNGHAVSGSAGECQIFIRDPQIMTTTISGLKASKAYKVAVVAVTGGGETAKEFMDVVTPVDEQTMMWSFLLPVVMVMLLGVTLLIIGCWKREWLKEQCYPDIPQPNKSKALSFTSPKGHSRVMQEVNCAAQKVELVQVVENGKDHDLKDISDQQMDVMYSTIQKPSNLTSSETSNDAYSTNNSKQVSYINYANKKLLYPPTEDLLYKPMEDLLYKTTEDALYKPIEDLLYKPTEDPLYKPQSPVYLEFFNQNYTGTPDDTLEDDSSSGYRPQTSTAMFHQSSCEDPSHTNHTQYTSIDDGPDLQVTSFESVSGCENEPMSPTSVTSTSFILVD